MGMHVSFPKDKEEMKKKRMEALMQKISQGEASAAQPADLTGRDGERRIQAITDELRKYYKDNREVVRSPPALTANKTTMNWQGGAASISGSNQGFPSSRNPGVGQPDQMHEAYRSHESIMTDASGADYRNPIAAATAGSQMFASNSQYQ